MDFHQMEGSSSLHSGKMQQQNRQSFRVEPANMAKSVEQQNYRHTQLQSHHNIEEQLHQAENGLQPEPDVRLEKHQEYAGTSLLSESNHSDLVQKAESVVTKVTAEAVNLMKCQVEKKVQYLNIDHKIKELCEHDRIGKMRSIEIQMENEGLSQEKDVELRSSDRLALRFTNTLDICELLKEHYEKLQFTAEQVEKLRNEFCVQYALLSNDLKTQSKNRKALTVEYVNNVDCLKKTVEEEHQLRISEINDANSNYQGQVKCLSEKMLILKNEEEKHSTLNVQDEELDKSITEEELNLKEKLRHAYESLHSFMYKNETLENEVNSYKGKEKELENSLHSIADERDCFKRQTIGLEELFETINNEEKILIEELNNVKERLSCHETENSGKHNLEDAYEKENLDLLQQRSQCEDKHKDVSRKLEDTRTKYECLTQDLTDLTVNLESVQAENQMISNRYLSELSDLESALEIVKKEADSKHTKIKDQNNIVNALQQEFAEENSLMKSHQLKLQSLKTSMTDEVAKMETQRAFVQEEKTRSEEVNKLLLVRQSEVEKLREEIERKLQEHTDYKKEMLMAINQTREETKAVKDKQEKRDLERVGKRQEIMKGLRECRNDSIEEADKKEAELDAQRKINCNLKEKLHNISTHKESIERDLEIQRRMLECKIRQLQIDLENEITQSAVWSKSQTSEQGCPSVQVYSAGQPYVKARFEDKDITSDSDRSSIDYCDLVKRLSSVKKISQLQPSDPGKRRRLETYQQSEKVQTGGTKDDNYRQSVYRTTPWKYEVKTGRFKSSKRKQPEPLDILSSL